MEVTGRGIEDSKYNNIEQSKITSIDAFKPVCLLEVAEPKCYYGLCYELHNNTLKGHATLLKTVVKAFDMIIFLKEHKTISPGRTQKIGKATDHVRSANNFYNTTTKKITKNQWEV